MVLTTMMILTCLAVMRKMRRQSVSKQRGCRNTPRGKPKNQSSSPNPPSCWTSNLYETFHTHDLKVSSIIPVSNVWFFIDQWDDETEMSKLEECVRSVQMDGLLWGASKLVPVGYGIKKLQISCVVEDDKVGTDILEEEITKFEDYVSAG